MLELLDLELVGACVDLPVEVAEVVAGCVGAVLCELDGDAGVGGAVLPAHDALDDHFGAELEGVEACEGAGVEVEVGVDLGAALV